MPDGNKSKVIFENETEMNVRKTGGNKETHEKKIIKPQLQQQQQKKKKKHVSRVTTTAVTVVGTSATKSGGVIRKNVHGAPEAASGSQKVVDKVYVNMHCMSAANHDEFADEETMTVQNYVRLLQNRLIKEFQSHSIADNDPPLTAPFIFTQDVTLTLKKRVLNAIQVGRALIDFFSIFIFINFQIFAKILRKYVMKIQVANQYCVKRKQLIIYLFLQLHLTIITQIYPKRLLKIIKLL